MIDDEPALLRVLQHILGRTHEVFPVDRAYVALARICEGESFDLIFCDLMMPEMNGIEFLAHLKEGHPALAERLVFLSGGAPTPAAQAFLAATTQELVRKPFDGRELLALVERRVSKTP